MSTPEPINFEDYDSNNQPRPALVAQRPFAPAAEILTGGLFALITGQFVHQAGRASYASDSSSYLGASAGASVAMIVGALLALVGLVAVLIGTYRLATNVDTTAKASLDAAAAASVVRSGPS